MRVHFCKIPVFHFYRNDTELEGSGLPGGDGNFCQAVEQHGWRQPDKGHHRAVQELQLSNQHVGRLGTRGDLLHEVEVDLCDRQKQH